MLNAEVLLTRASAEHGRLTLPDGMSYRYLVLPHGAGWAVSPAVLRKIRTLAEAGVTIIGPKPDRARDWPISRSVTRKSEPWRPGYGALARRPTAGEASARDASCGAGTCRRSSGPTAWRLTSNSAS